MKYLFFPWGGLNLGGGGGGVLHTKVCTEISQSFSSPGTKLYFAAYSISCLVRQCYFYLPVFLSLFYCLSMNVTLTLFNLIKTN